MSLLPVAASSQFRDTSIRIHTYPRVDSEQVATLQRQIDSAARADVLARAEREKATRELTWLMGSFSLHDYFPHNVGNDQYGIGWTYKFGVVSNNRFFQFDAHCARAPFATSPAEESRYDYALIYGKSIRNEFSFLNFGGGFSVINYLQHGSVLIPPTYPDGMNGTYKTNSGTAYGVSAMADIYWTPFSFWGALGIGLYGTLATNSQSYFAVDFSIIELNLPIPVR